MGLTRRRSEKLLRRVEHLLLDTVVPFWFPSKIDEKHGGYLVELDHTNPSLGPQPKRTVTQARMMWFFARLYRSRYGEEGHLRAAQHGYELLVEHLWDSVHGGYFWTVGPGEQPPVDHKHIESHTFALYGLSEYALVTGDQEAARLARQTFEVIETQLRDDDHGGYFHSSTRDFTQERYPGSWRKRLGGHLHLMEAYTNFYSLTKDPAVKERIVEAMLIMTSTTTHTTAGICTEMFERDWSPRREGSEIVFFGHNLETIWLLMVAFERTGLPDASIDGWYRRCFARCLELGWDRRRGGFYLLGDVEGKVHDRRRLWWVHAEALIASLRMYMRFDDPSHLESFEATMTWIEHNQVDRKHGEWFNAVVPGLFRTRAVTPEDVEGKDAYHQGRALIECAELLGD